MMNLIGEIAQYAIETDQIIRQLAQERDQLKQVVDGQQEEIKHLERRITDGKAENQRLIANLNELRSVRIPDNGVGNTGKEALSG